jgi:hypothetical protein
MGGVIPRSTPWWGVKYPSGTVIDYPFGKEQAEMVWMLCLREGMNVQLVQSTDRGRSWH